MLKYLKSLIMRVFTVKNDYYIRGKSGNRNPVYLGENTKVFYTELKYARKYKKVSPRRFYRLHRAKLDFPTMEIKFEKRTSIEVDIDIMKNRVIT